MSNLYQISFSSPLGQILLKSDDGIALNNLDFIEGDFSQNSTPLLELAKKQLNEYFTKKRKTFTIPLKTYGTPFQKEVWQTLQKIPYSSTISYKQESIMVNRPKAFRAVANANGKNPISIIIPCHRVIASDGTLGGYSGGLDKKIFLLELERCK